MNRIIIGVASLLLSVNFASAQHVFNPQNARDGETVEYCHQHVKLEQLRLTNPAAYQQMMADQEALNEAARNYTPEKSGVVYTIPVVFHILHDNGTENITNEQVFDAVAILNRDFRRLNADADLVQTPFQGMPADAEIEFKLATIAPNGACFNGITRTQSPYTVEGSGGGTQQLQTIFNSNDVYQGTWAHNKYLNIVVAKEIGGAAGYTQYPNNGWGNAVFSNSIWILHNYVGSIGTGSVTASRALTHEVGHWLNLSHTWGDNNNPGNASSCSQDDHVQDTPLCIGVTSCSLFANTCDDTNDPNNYSSWATDVVDNVENYMDYSYCSKMYTPGQVARMRAAITSTTGGRNNIWTTANLNAVGAIDNPPLCKAEFQADKKVICAGETVQFTDLSYNTVSGWTWTFQGGTPATSTSENPTVVYSTPGTYQVVLTATNAGVTRTETKTSYITVLAQPSGLPFHEGFENYTTLADAQGKWFVDNQGNNDKFEVTTTAAYTGSKSVKLANFNQAAGNLDELISSSVNLSGQALNDVTLSFRYAYRKKATANNDYLKIYMTSDCGNAWQMKKLFNASTMTTGNVTSTWTPSGQADWKTVHIPFDNTSYTQYLVDNFRYKFSFEGNGGNNFFLDDINIYNGAPSDEIVLLGLDDVEGLKDITLYPNPNDGEVNVSFSLDNAQKVTLTIMDISGKELKSTVINGNTGDNVVLLSNTDFASGVYFVQLKTASSNKTLQFIKK